MGAPLILGGMPVRNANWPHANGTIACMVQSRSDPGVKYLLTAGHAIAMNGYARPGHAIETSVDGGHNWFKIAEFIRATPLRDAQGVMQACDAAIARLTVDEGTVGPGVAGLGEVRGTSTALYRDKPLRFRGAKTGVCTDVAIHSQDVEVPVIYDELDVPGTFRLDFARQILYGRAVGSAWRAVTQAVDSGALVMDDRNRAVGMHIAVTPPDFPETLSVCSPIDAILDALDCWLPGVPDPHAQSVALPGATAVTAQDRVGIKSLEVFKLSIRGLLEPHRHEQRGPVCQLVAEGLVVDGQLPRTAGMLVTVPNIWAVHGEDIRRSAAGHGVPVELIVATIATESRGDNLVRTEPGWTSDDATPDRVSVGPMQVLISTARWMLKDQALTREGLLKEATCIEAGTMYIAYQRKFTNLDPALVACAYNAGRLEYSASNRWQLVQTAGHADRFVEFFNDCMAFFRLSPQSLPQDAPSYSQLFREGDA